MNYKLTIHCIREHLEKAKWCGLPEAESHDMKNNISGNCWIAVAVQEIFPICRVEHRYIDNLQRINSKIDTKHWFINLPMEATEMINKFDSCKIVEERMKLEPFSFTVNIPQETLDTIMECNGLRSMKELDEIVFRTPHLQLEAVEN